MDDMSEMDSTSMKFRRMGCLLAGIALLLVGAWIVRVILATWNGRNGSFVVSGWVEDEQGHRVADAHLKKMTVVSQFPHTDTKYESTYIQLSDGTFHVEASDVSDLDIQALKSGVGLSDSFSVGRGRSGRPDWLGRHLVELHDVRLVLRRTPTTQTVKPLQSPSLAR